MGFFLLDNRNPNGDHFYPSRRKPLLAIVVHITAGLEDRDNIGPDASAEDTAHYAATTDRDVSWHSGSDSDSWVDLLPYSYTAWQCVNYNSSTAGHEISKAETDWRDDPAEWVTRTLTVAGVGLGKKARANGIPLRKCTRAELDNAIAHGGPPVGFISHHELDPTRRTDPGWVGSTDTFPWARFFAIANGQPQEVDPLVSITLDDIGKEVWEKLLTFKKQHLDGTLNRVKDIDETRLPAIEERLTALETKVGGTQ